MRSERGLSARLVVAALLLGAAALSAPGCGGGEGDGSGAPPDLVAAEVEANGTFATATPLSATGSGQGDVVVAGDVDFWSFPATAGQTIRVELHALRRDQATWAAATNLAHLTLFDTNGTGKLLDHDFSAEAWVHGAGDLDFPAYRIPATGTYFLRVAQDVIAATGGAYVLRVRPTTLPAPVQQETEPASTSGVNDTALTAQAIVPGTVHGWHVDGESDFFSFVLTTPARVSFEALAYRQGLSRGDAGLFDTHLKLYDAGLVVLQQAEDVAAFDATLSRLLLTPGTYFVELNDDFGTGDGEYLLFFERNAAPAAATEGEPNDVAAQATVTTYGAISRGTTSSTDPDLFRFAGQAGDVVEVQVFDTANAEGSAAAVVGRLVASDGVTLLPQSVGSAAGTSLQVSRAILTSTGNHFVRVVGAGPSTGYAFLLSRFFTSTREVEPNDSLATAGALAVGTRVSGAISAPGDQDHFSFTAVAGEVIVLSVYGGLPLHANWTHDDFDQLGSPLLPRLTLFDPAAAPVALATRTPAAGQNAAQSVTDGLACVSLTFVAPTTGTYKVQLTDEGGAGSPAHGYLLERR